ncbi:unnamed protein product, partial [marine sediment metagenome]
MIGATYSIRKEPLFDSVRFFGYGGPDKLVEALNRLDSQRRTGRYKPET